MDNRDVQMIRDFSNAFGPSGFEEDVISIIRHYINELELGNVKEDSLRNLYIYRKENKGNRPIFMLDAHSDEVGFIIRAIKADGTLQFIQLGGWDKLSLPSSKILVRNANGKYIQGVLASKPRQFMNESEREQFKYDESQLGIDIGATSKGEAIESFHIRIGEPAAPATKFEINNMGQMWGKAFDCRIGCVALVETLRRLKNIELPFDVVGVFSAQEELGDRGCKVAVNRIRPSIAFCFEGCPADDTFNNEIEAQTVLKEGPMMRFMDRSVLCTPRYQRYVLDLAQQKHLKVQCAVRKSGGTNASIINTAYDGIPVVVAGIPVRYIHTCNSLAYYEDFEATVQLAVETIRTLTMEVVAKF